MAVTIAGRSLVLGTMVPDSGTARPVGLVVVISLSLLQRGQDSGKVAIDKCRRTPTQDE